MEKIHNILLILILSVSFIQAQEEGLWPGDPEAEESQEEAVETVDAPGEVSSENSEEVGQQVDDAAEEVPTRSRYEIRRETILYGIESEVLEVLNDISSERDDSYNQDLLDLIQYERKEALLEKVFQIFIDTEFLDGGDLAMEILQDALDDQEISNKVTMAVMTYLAELEIEESIDLFYDFLNDGDDAIVSYSLSQIGKFGEHERSSELLDLFNDEEEEGNDIALNVIIAWGKMQYLPAVDILIELVEDEYAEKSHREYAAVALGEIGDPQGIDPVISLYESSDDATLRGFALSGLTKFDDPRIDEILIQALRRDSYWRIRVAAAQGLGERNNSNAVELLEYKLRRDPEDHVKRAAAQALGEISSTESNLALLDYLGGENSEALRLEVLKVLMNNQIDGTLEAFISIMDQDWDKEDTQGKFLEYCCREAALIEWNALGPAYLRMLSHSNHLVQIYGIRGIARNDLTQYYDQVRQLDREGVNGLVRREAVEF